MLTGLTVVDLTAELSPDTVMWPGEAPPRAVVTDRHERDGSFSREITLGEHSGTHFDAPVHFTRGAPTVAEVAPDRLVLPVRVIDISARAARDPDAELTLADVEAHERDCGPIAAGAAVFLRTDWDLRAGAVEDDGGPAGDLRFPGFGPAAARLLVGDRGVLGLGIDTLGIDPGRATDFPVHRDVSLPRGVWHLENLVGLAAVPPVGAWVFVGVPKVAGASGFPARVLALVPHAHPLGR
ncbi:MAG: cyclase family protein [Actinomycetota bacterium]|nr:cyclase family protein [Actinomycetota bacterium]